MSLTETVVTCRVCTQVLAHWPGRWVALTCVDRPRADGLGYVQCPACGAVTQLERLPIPDPRSAARPAPASRAEAA